jgi:hypothetical protein
VTTHWDAADRRFDRVTSGQAWQWLDMPAATAKAASLLRPNGRIGLIWSGGAPPDDLADALEEVYSAVVPSGTHRLFRGYAANRSTDIRSDLDPVLPAIAGPAAAVVQRVHGARAEPSPPPARRRRATIDDYGGSFVVNFETVLIAATRRG